MNAVKINDDHAAVKPKNLILHIFSFKRSWFLIFAPLSFLLTAVAQANPELTDALYSQLIYKKISFIIGYISGAVPFSIVELLIYAAFLAVPMFLFFSIRKIIREHELRRKNLAQLTAAVICIASMWYSLSVLMCGLNYHRLTFTSYIGLSVRQSSVSELSALCSELVASVNELRNEVSEDANGNMKLSFSSYYETSAYASRAYDFVGVKYPILSGYTPIPKPVFASKAMSHMDIVGIFIPFTYESNVNTDVPDYNIPSSMMHELSHYKGFMREDEANFIAYLACILSDNDDFRYSGAMLALINSTNALYAADRDAYDSVMSALGEKIRGDLLDNSRYWKKFEGPVSDISVAVNNTYLKANSQSDGVKSYGRMVDLLLAEYRLRHGIE